MIWRKAWLECRLRVVLGAILTVALVVAGLAMFPGNATLLQSTAKVWDLYAFSLAALVAIMVVNFAGSGVNTQSIWGVFHGFHPSMYFFLSLPVSRRKALLVRAAVGWLLTLATILAGALPFALLAPLRGVSVSAGDVLASICFLTIGSAPLFGIVTLLTTVLDETWAGVLGYAVFAAFFGFGIGTFRSQPRFNVLLFVNGQLFRQTHDAHWLTIAAYLAVGAACLMASIVVVERKEY